LEIKLRKLLAARREMLEEEVAGDVEARLDELQAGFEGVRRVEPNELPEAVEEPAADAGPPAWVRRLGQSAAPVADLSDFWGRTGMLYRDGETAALLPDPFLAAGSLPPLSAALRGAAPRAVLPAFDPAACTGCGDCWTACPHAALGPAVLGAGALIDHAMGLAKSRGRATDKLRMVTSKLAAAVGQVMGSEKWAGDRAAPLFDAAFEPMIGKMKLPEERKAAIREAYAAVRPEIAALPVARTAAFFDRAEAASRGDGDLFTLAVDPEACKGCGLCVSACEPEALTAVADDPRRSAAAGELWRLVEELPEPGEATVERARQDPEVGPLAGALLSPAARRVMGRGDGAEAGSGEVLALRQVLGAAAFHRRPVDEGLLAEIGEVRGKLAEAIHDGLSRALPDRDLDALARGLDALDRPDTDLADLTSRIEAAFETDRVDVSRTRRLVAAARALADLEGRLGGGERRAPFGLVVAAGERAPAWAGAFPHNPFAVPVTLAAPTDAGDLARGVLEGQLRQTLEVVRALRRARLELENPNGPRPADLDALDRLGWQDLEPGERRLCPPVFLIASEDALAAHPTGLAGLLGALASDLPLKLLVLADQDRDTETPFDLGLLASAERRALILQTSIAAGDHLEGGVAAALAHDGPAFLRVHAPSAEGYAPDATLKRAREALAAGVLPLLLSPPGAPGVRPTGRPELGQLASDGSDKSDVSDASDVSAAAPPPDEAAIAALEQRHAAELAALRGEYEARIAGLRASFQQETAQRIRSRLLQLATAQRPAAAAPTEAQPEEPPA
jgi:pyruvate-ferredoxin/flavodoxin oxidoreductase